MAAALSAAIIPGCTNDLDFKFKDESPKIVMNMLTSTSMTSHEVRLSLSKVDAVEKLEDARVVCTVNGTKVADAVAVDGGVGNETYYVFDAQFKPGDKVRIDAFSKDGSAYAELVVPAKPVTGPLDTLGRTMRKSDIFSEPSEVLLCRYPVTSSKDSHHFMLSPYVSFTSVAYYDEGDGNLKPSAAETITRDMFVYPDNDVVLEDGGAVAGGSLIDELLGNGERLNLFTDKYFSGESHTLRYMMETSMLKNVIFDFPGGEGLLDHVDVTVYIGAKVEAITEIAYHYLKSASSYMGAEMGFLFEPTSIPGNVIGGLGIVSISSVSDTDEMKVREFSIDYQGGIYY